MHFLFRAATFFFCPTDLKSWWGLNFKLILFTWHHQIPKSKAKEPQKVWSSSGIRGSQYIYMYLLTFFSSIACLVWKPAQFEVRSYRASPSSYYARSCYFLVIDLWGKKQLLEWSRICKYATHWDVNKLIRRWQTNWYWSNNARLHFSSRKFGSTCMCSQNWLIWTSNAKGLKLLQMFTCRSSKLTGGL